MRAICCNGWLAGGDGIAFCGLVGHRSRGDGLVPWTGDAPQGSKDVIRCSGEGSEELSENDTPKTRTHEQGLAEESRQCE